MTNFLKHKMRGKSTGEIIGIIIFGGMFIIGFIILFGFITMWLWNWLMPMIFGLTTLTFWEAIGVLILAKILIGGCNFGDKDKKSSKSFKRDKECKGEFSKWKHYDNFWKEEGNQAYEAYKERMNNQTKTDD